MQENVVLRPLTRRFPDVFPSGEKEIQGATAATAAEEEDKGEEVSSSLLYFILLY